MRPGRSVTVKFCLSGPEISIESVSPEKDPTCKLGSYFSPGQGIPITLLASENHCENISEVRFSSALRTILRLNSVTRLRFSSDTVPCPSSAGFMEMVTMLSAGSAEDSVPAPVRRNVTWVAKRVHKPASRGNGNSVRASKTDDFPLLWSPTTTS